MKYAAALALTLASIPSALAEGPVPSPACESKLIRILGEVFQTPATTRDLLTGLPLLGFSSVAYDERLLSVALVLETAPVGAAARRYYYFEPCDICAEIWVCEEGVDTRVEEFRTGHVLDCSDLPKEDRVRASYSDCEH